MLIDRQDARANRTTPHSANLRRRNPTGGQQAARQGDKITPPDALYIMFRPALLRNQQLVRANLHIDHIAGQIGDHPFGFIGTDVDAE